MTDQWLFKSETYDNCNCQINCGCQFNVPSTNGDERARVTAAIFWMKTRGGWSETSTHKHTGVANGDPIEVEVVTVREQQLMLGPLIIRDQRDRPDQQEIVLMPNDFSFTPPEEIFANLKKGSKCKPTAVTSLQSMRAGSTPMPANNLRCWASSKSSTVP